MNKKIRGIILFSKPESQLTPNDYSVVRLLQAARERDIEIQIVCPEQFELVITRSDEKSILIDDKLESPPDFVIPRMGSSTSYYAFAVIRQLEHLGSYVCNGADAIYSVKDKLYMHQILSTSRLSSPRTMLLRYPISQIVVKREIGFPLVIKNVSGTQGVGIYLCESESKFIDIMDLIYANNPRANIILQEFISKSYGKDLRVFVVGGKVVGCMQRSSSNSFKANFSRGGQVSSFELTPEIEWLSTETARLFKLDIAGVDLLFDDSEFKICEANSSPGFLGLEKVTGKVIAESIIDYILLRIGLNSEIN
ncbi:RimK family alpha-L-glutamate ligase [Gammaproteobacteria bacterium]|nr:RimK family alpha-L-glutamate ligase [Gammaproteobacteria bacterium]